MAIRSQTQRALLFSFIASVGTCGAIGIWILLIGTFGRIEGKVLGSTAVVGAASILGLAAAVPTERRRWHPIGPAGLLAVGTTLVVVLCWIWDAFDGLPPPVRDKLERLTGNAAIIATALPLIGLLALARLRRAYEATRIGTVASIAALSALSIVIIWAHRMQGDVAARTLGILAILSACGTIATPILHRISAIRLREAVQTTELALSLTCPRCNRAQTRPVGRSKCEGCGLKFAIEIEEEQCRKCGYPLHELTSAVCPECGTPIAEPPSPTPA